MTAEDLYEEISQKWVEGGEVIKAQMFGKPCLKVGGKTFAAFHQECVIFKIGKSGIDELNRKFANSRNWDPSGKGRPMKDWLQLGFEHASEWESLASAAMNFVSDQA